jgi:hypothetical protein
MLTDPPISDVAHVIQLVVAPAFLITGIGAMLGVMTTRLARTVDRARVIEALDPDDPRYAAEFEREIAVLRRRARLIGLSVGLCTFAALLIAAVIGILFLSAVIELRAAMPVSLLFITAMVALILALLFFLREVYVASASLRIGRR